VTVLNRSCELLVEMGTTINTVAVLLALSFGLSNSTVVLDSPRITNWGDWGIWERCSPGEFVVGMRLKTERITYSVTGDNTGLNGIQFFCAKPGDIISGRKFITSSYANWGTWGSTYQCPGKKGVATGFQLRSESSKGAFLGLVRFDDTAGNNLRIFCNGSKSPIEGDGNSWGSWTASMQCFAHQAICGLRTQIEWAQGWRDDTALNNIQVECCDLPADYLPDHEP